MSACACVDIWYEDCDGCTLTDKGDDIVEAVREGGGKPGGADRPGGAVGISTGVGCTGDSVAGGGSWLVDPLSDSGVGERRGGGGGAVSFGFDTFVVLGVVGLSDWAVIAGVAGREEDA